MDQAQATERVMYCLDQAALMRGHDNEAHSYYMGWARRTRLAGWFRRLP